MLLRAADLREAHTDELADLEVADTGKPRDVTRDEEIPASIDVVRFYAGACRMPEGRSTGEYIEGVTSGIRREPVGVCGQITPWNYPFMMAVWKWAPAVAAGNTLVLKTSAPTPSSTSRLGGPLAPTVPSRLLNVPCARPHLTAAGVVDLPASARPHAKIVAGGGSPDRDGFHLEPTVVAGLRQDDELVQSEIFGPVITVQSYRGDDEGLAMANGVEQGLTASVWTDSHSRAMRFLRDLDFGAVSVNAHAPMGSELPHGGFGSSGYGKDPRTHGL